MKADWLKCVVCSHRRAHHDLGSLLQRLGLLPHASSTVNRHGTQRVGLPETLTLCVDLGQFQGTFMVNQVYKQKKKHRTCQMIGMINWINHRVVVNLN